MFKLSILGRGQHLVRRTLLAQAVLAGALGPLLAQAQPPLPASQAGAAQERRVSLQLPAQPLDQALTRFADQADLRLLYTTSDVAGLQAPALAGEVTIAQALQALLAGSGMGWSFSDGRTVILRRAEPAASSLNLKPTQVTVASRTSTAISEIPGTVWVVEQSQLREQLETGVSLKEAIGKLVPGLTWRRKAVPTMARTCAGATCW